MLIEPMTPHTLPKAKALVDRVFPLQSPAERLFFRAWRHSDNPMMRTLLALGGVTDLGDFWLARDDDGEVLGTVGLYRYRKDAHEAVWLSWFCVAPEARSRGVGGILLDFAIERARETGARFLRLYTSDEPMMASAQRLYESRGLCTYETRNRILYTLIRCQLELV